MGSHECVLGVKMFLNLIVFSSHFAFFVWSQQFHQPKGFQESNHHHHHQRDHQVLHNDINMEKEHVQEHIDIPDVDVKGHLEEHGDFKIFSDEEFAQQIDPVLMKD